MVTLADRNNHAGRWLAAIVALVAALPGLRVPFLSDDWAQVAAAANGRLLATPFQDFRPLFMTLYWLDLKVWGAHAFGFHLTNVALLALASALVVSVADRFTNDKQVSTLAGVLFALHPYHVENAAWIAGRADALQAVFYLLALLSFERWRTSGRRLPYATLALAEAALLSKESAVTLSALLALRCILIVDLRERRRALWFGVLPNFILTSAHFLILRPFALSGFGRTLASGFGIAWLKDACGFAAATIVPLEVERLSYRPALWGAVAIGAWLLLLVSGFRDDKGMPRTAWVALCAFAVLVSPNLAGFQERYLFLPVA
ncbi:MAG TPA: hypothetical protein VE258_05160, partial [Ktedonobacterales bacterium]|nr:hypothetical protein [Ktedonobacterales bacterium]